MRACLIVNARAGSGRFDLDGVLAALRAAHWDVTVSARRYGPGELAAESAAERYDAAIACGGDGTLREVVAGLLGTPVAVGMIPAGTVNLWARELGIAADSVRAARQLVRAALRRVDVGRLTMGEGPARHFLLMAGLGFDGAVMTRVTPRLKRRLGPAAVAVAVAQVAPTAQPIHVRVEAGSAVWEGRAAQIVVGNTRRYGGFTAITPDALADDGLLDLSLLTPDGPLDTVRLLATLIIRGRPAGRGLIRRRAATIAIHARAPIPVQLDGDPLPPTAQSIAAPNDVVYRFSALAGASTMLVPREYRGPLLGAYPRHAALEGARAMASGHDDLDAMGLGAVGHFERTGEPE